MAKISLKEYLKEPSAFISFQVHYNQKSIFSIKKIEKELFDKNGEIMVYFWNRTTKREITLNTPSVFLRGS